MELRRFLSSILYNFKIRKIYQRPWSRHCFHESIQERQWPTDTSTRMSLVEKQHEISRGYDPRTAALVKILFQQRPRLYEVAIIREAASFRRPPPPSTLYKRVARGVIFNWASIAPLPRVECGTRNEENMLRGR